MEKRFRTWTRESEVKLEGLVRAVEDALERGRGAQAAREAVPEWVGADSITGLAKTVGVDRASLSMCLGAEGPYWSTRAALDQGLGLPPGGMTRVLSMVEAHNGEK